MKNVNVLLIFLLNSLFSANQIKKSIISCYKVDKFFVEVVYDGEHNVITEVRSFKYGQELDKYAPKID